MTQFTQAAEKAQEQVLSTLEQVRELNVSAAATIGKTVGDIVPELPTLSFAENLPTAREVVEVVFGFAHRLLDAQQAYVLGLIDAVAPVTEKISPNPAARKTAKPAPKTSAAKA